MWLPVVAFGLGAAAKLFVPWLIKRYRNPDSPESKWNWRYLWPQLAAFVVVVLVAPLITPDIDTILTLSPVPAYLAGWGLGDQAKTLFLDTGVVSK
jgi:hypothetical protein